MNIELQSKFIQKVGKSCLKFLVLGTVHFLSGGVGWWFLRGATRKNSDVKGGWVTSGKLNFEGGAPKHQ
jgi:hypothetical protein